MDLTELAVGVVGASLAGLSVANVLERAGARVTLIERGDASFSERGGGLGVSVELARKVTGPGAPPHVVHDRRRVWVRGKEWEAPAQISVTAYGMLWRWLRERLRAVRVHHGRRVTAVEPAPSGARVTTADGWAEDFDLVVAADGGGSELRRLVEGHDSERSYAGYVLWRGLVPAAELDDARYELTSRFHVASRGNHHFVAYAIPDGAAERGLVNWGWYHPWPSRDLPEVVDRTRLSPPHVLQRDAAVHALFADALQRDGGRWPDWVRHVFERSRACGAVAPHPVHEKVPGRLARGRVALVGDAAHLARPITGSGARMAMEDAVILGEALRSASSVEAALAAYANARGAYGARVVLEGHQRGAAFAVLEDG